MYRILAIVITIILLLSTVCISFIKPEMHKSVLVYDSAYRIVQPEENSVETKVLPTQTNTPPVQTTKTYSPQNNTKTQKVITRVVEIPAAQKNTRTAQQKTTQTQKTVSPVKKTVKKTTTPAKTTQQITQEQEVILWNKWRSDLQNQIMRDVRLPIVQEGTVFKFSFEVDKYGKISNVQTWSTNPVYTPYAIQYIAPVIKSYQGRSILNFPSGSNRIVTLVEGGWKIANATKYSTPADFKDIETLRN